MDGKVVDVKKVLQEQNKVLTLQVKGGEAHHLSPY